MFLSLTILSYLNIYISNYHSFNHINLNLTKEITLIILTKIQI